VCNKPQKGKYIAQHGQCAFKFVGGVGESSILKQKLSSGQTSALGAGDTLKLNANVKTAALTAGGKLQIIVAYQDTALNKEKVTAPIPTGTGDYRALTTPTLTLDGQPKKVFVRVFSSAAGGTFFVDSISLVKNGIAAAPSSGLVALPPAAQ
jgi:hypothetical protein